MEKINSFERIKPICNDHAKIALFSISKAYSWLEGIPPGFSGRLVNFISVWRQNYDEQIADELKGLDNEPG